MYYSLIGTLVVFIVGYPVSLMTGGCDDLNERLLAPPIRRLFSNYLKELKIKISETKLNKNDLKPLNVKFDKNLDSCKL